MTEAQSTETTVQTRWGAIDIRGKIFLKWTALGAVLSPDGDDVRAHLGDPLGPASPILADHGGGAMQLFKRGMIVERQDGRTFVVYGAIYDAYLAIGGPTSTVGQPISDEAAARRGGRVNRFDKGDIYWHEDFGPRIVRGIRLSHYAAHGYPFKRSLASRAISFGKSSLSRVATKLRRRQA